MTAATDVSASQAPTSPLARTIDKWIFVFMAVFFIAVTFAGFVPDSMMKMELVETGQRPPFPLALHLHAILMGTFLLLLLTQAVLMAMGRKDFHQRLGIAAMVVAPALIIVGVWLVPTMYHQLWNGAQAAPPQVAAGIRQVMLGFDNIMLLQLQVGVTFTVLVALSLANRKADLGLHKRLVFLAVATALPAAFDRITWIPTTAPESPLSAHLYVLFAAAPMFLWDLARTRRIHKAYWIFLALFIPTSVVVHLLWDSAWWHAMAPKLVGVG